MVPVTGEDALLDAPFAQGESHVRAAVVEREYSPLMRAKQQRAIVASHRHHSLLLQFGERRDAEKFSEIKEIVSGAHNVGRKSWLDIIMISIIVTTMMLFVIIKAGCPDRRRPSYASAGCKDNS
jgi:hypothetical protein